MTRIANTIGWVGVALAAVALWLPPGAPAGGTLLQVDSELTCLGQPLTQMGTAGNDVIVGTPDRDVIFSLAGKDVVKGLGSNDRLCGGLGRDVLVGGDGNDKLSGGQGHDVHRGGRGNDLCLGGGGALDTAKGCEGQKQI